MRKAIGKLRLSLRALGVHVQETTGQTLAEYSILVTVVALGITLLAMTAFRDDLAGLFNSVANCLDGSC